MFCSYSLAFYSLSFSNSLTRSFVGSYFSFWVIGYCGSFVFFSDLDLASLQSSIHFGLQQLCLNLQSLFLHSEQVSNLQHLHFIMSTQLVWEYLQLLPSLHLCIIKYEHGLTCIFSTAGSFSFSSSFRDVSFLGFPFSTLSVFPLNT